MKFRDYMKEKDYPTYLAYGKLWLQHDKDENWIRTESMLAFIATLLLLFAPFISHFVAGFGVACAAIVLVLLLILANKRQQLKKELKD